MKKMTKGLLTDSKIARKVSALQRQYARKRRLNQSNKSFFLADTYSESYLNKILENIRRLTACMGKPLYISTIHVYENDKMGMPQFAGVIEHGPVIKETNALGEVRYTATYDPPRERRVRG